LGELDVVTDDDGQAPQWRFEDTDSFTRLDLPALTLGRGDVQLVLAVDGTGRRVEVRHVVQPALAAHGRGATDDVQLVPLRRLGEHVQYLVRHVGEAIDGIDQADAAPEGGEQLGADEFREYQQVAVIAGGGVDEVFDLVGEVTQAANAVLVVLRGANAHVARGAAYRGAGDEAFARLEVGVWQHEVRGVTHAFLVVQVAVVHARHLVAGLQVGIEGRV